MHMQMYLYLRFKYVQIQVYLKISTISVQMLLNNGQNLPASEATSGQPKSRSHGDLRFSFQSGST
jgi:hypothetical protein